jgi:hypothetical protein
MDPFGEDSYSHGGDEGDGDNAVVGCHDYCLRRYHPGHPGLCSPARIPPLSHWQQVKYRGSMTTVYDFAGPITDEQVSGGVYRDPRPPLAASVISQWDTEGHMKELQTRCQMQEDLASAYPYSGYPCIVIYGLRPFSRVIPVAGRLRDRGANPIQWCPVCCQRPFDGCTCMLMRSWELVDHEVFVCYRQLALSSVFPRASERTNFIASTNTGGIWPVLVEERLMMNGFVMHECASQCVYLRSEGPNYIAAQFFEDSDITWVFNTKALFFATILLLERTPEVVFVTRCFDYMNLSLHDRVLWEIEEKEAQEEDGVGSNED